jgi:lysophospholipase L1-like esterase
MNASSSTLLAVTQPISGIQSTQRSPADSIVLIGASYAEGWPIVSIAERPVINRGVSGEETAAVLARFRRDVVDPQPAYVIIWGFINDIFRGERNSIEDKLVQTRRHIREMVALAQAHKIVPILATEVTIRRKQGFKEALMAFILGTLLQRSSYQDYVNEQVGKVNSWLAEFAEQQNLILLDFQSQLADDDGYRRAVFATPDGSHISKEGYAALSEYVQTELAGRID